MFLPTYCYSNNDYTSANQIRPDSLKNKLISMMKWKGRHNEKWNWFYRNREQLEVFSLYSFTVLWLIKPGKQLWWVLVLEDQGRWSNDISLYIGFVSRFVWSIDSSTCNIQQNSLHFIFFSLSGASLHVADSRYFWFHHSEGDTMTVQDPREMNLCSALWAVVAYVVADLEDMLPR